MKNLFLLIILGLAFLINLSPSYAQEPSSTSSSSATVDYPLPYPGILPDNPLYFMKALRDRIVSLFISDPLKKAEFNLLMADVRLNAAQYLFAKGEGKYSLAETTISKGENYFYNALIMVNDAKQQGMRLNDFVPKLITAAKKHQQVIKDLKIKSPSFIRDRLTEDEKRAKDFEIRAIQIKLN
ncbi:MAG: DUF5667 domain-containing protein [Patescibacteria group bacterium]|nr:DUF5667 domain-containing protein [Patescibacteria group bacterium]